MDIVMADDSAIFDTRRFFGDAAADWLLAAVNKKTHQASEIKVNGESKYLVVWHKDAQKMFFVNCVVEINGGAGFELLMGGVKQLARENGCDGLAAVVTRQGLLKKSLETGWKVAGVAVKYEF